MATSYISTAEANTYLETSWEDSIMAVLVDQASHLVDRFCGYANTSSWFAFSAWTVTAERHSYNGLWPYYFKYPSINSITTIMGTVVSYTEWTDYIVRGRRVEFSSLITLPIHNTTFNYITFTYTKGFETIPDDIKDACYIIVSWLYNARKSVGIGQFTQGDLSISYLGKILDDERYNTVKMLLSKYKTVNVIS